MRINLILLLFFQLLKQCIYFNSLRARKVGMDYDKSLFGMRLRDAMSLCKLLTKTATLNRVT